MKDRRKDVKRRFERPAVVRANPKISPMALEFYAEIFKTRNQGAEWAIEAMPRLARMTLAREVRGVCTMDELAIIVSSGRVVSLGLADGVLNGRPGENLFGIVRDHGESLCNGSGVDYKNLLEKINRLPLFHAASLEVFVSQYWNGSAPLRVTLEGWVKPLASDGEPAKAAE